MRYVGLWPRIDGLSRSIIQYREKWWVMSSFFSAVVQLSNGTSFYVLGSCPSATLEALREDQLLICANGSIELIGTRVPDVLLLNNPTLTGKDKVAQRSRKKFKGRDVRTLICITKEFTFSEMLSTVQELGLTFNHALEMTDDVRRQITGEVVGRKIPDSSGNALAAATGMIAVALAYLSGAQEIEVSGIDFGGGHFFAQGARRGHTVIDKEIYEIVTRGILLNGLQKQLHCTLAQRVTYQLAASQLSFACYRIRRRFSHPLPIASLPVRDVHVCRFNQPYPWQILCLWALEERLHALSGAAMFSQDKAAQQQCVKDLEALAQWPRYTVGDKLDLPFGHAVQLMATALREWTWLPATTKSALSAALLRAVEEGLLLVPASVRELASSQALLSKPNPHQYLHNILLIAQAALATAAEAIDHPERKTLSQRFQHLYHARLALYHEGLTEGISYDGYLANFALGWLSTQPSHVKEEIVHHPAMLDIESQARGQACPGAVWQSAEIGDVEPLEMPFVWSALARLQLPFQRIAFLRCSKARRQ